MTTVQHFGAIERGSDVKVGDVVCVGGNDGWQVRKAQSFDDVVAATRYSSARVGKVVSITPSGRVNVDLTNKKERNGKPVRMQFYKRYGISYTEYGKGNSQLHLPLTAEAADWWAWAENATDARRAAEQAEAAAAKAAERAQRKAALDAENNAALAANTDAKLCHMVDGTPVARITELNYMTMAFTNRYGNIAQVVVFALRTTDMDWRASKELDAWDVRYSVHSRDDYDVAQGRPGRWSSNDFKVAFDKGTSEAAILRLVRDKLVTGLW